MISRPAVRISADFRRIDALPRRTPTQVDAEDLVGGQTWRYACPGAEVTLRPWQAYALAEIAEHGGAVLFYPVGLGKTLISALAPVALGARRPVLIVPAALREKTLADFRSYRGKWRMRREPIRIVSREELALEANSGLLDQIRPDAIIIDEADDLANARSAAVRRIDRYLVAADQAGRDVAVVVMTGTPSRKSIMGYWHLICWALRDGAPVPLVESEAKAWAAAIDESGPCQRPRPGPLGRNLKAAREWFRRRLLETPGVVVVDGDSCDQPLVIRTRIAREDPALDEAFRRFNLEFETPGGVPISDPLCRWRLDGQLGCGLYTRWNPPPLDEWREARRCVAKFVRDSIARTARAAKPLDTEAQVLRWHADHPIVRRWLAVKDQFDPARSSEVVWLSDSAVASAVDWLASSAAPGIIWCGSVAYAQRLARAAGLAFYHRGGKTADGRYLAHASPERSLVASWNANKKGFNLQAWRRQLVVFPPQSAKWLEQIFGRSHRSGQDRPVTVDVLITSGGTIDAFQSATREAGFAKATTSMTQKILRARVERAWPKITPTNQYRWASRTEVG